MKIFRSCKKICSITTTLVIRNFLLTSARLDGILTILQLLTSAMHVRQHRLKLMIHGALEIARPVRNCRLLERPPKLYGYTMFRKRPSYCQILGGEAVVIFSCPIVIYRIWAALLITRAAILWRPPVSVQSVPRTSAMAFECKVHPSVWPFTNFGES